MQRHYHQIDGAIIMFDLTEPGTFDNVLGWKEDIDAMVTSKNPPIILLGNKVGTRLVFLFVMIVVSRVVSSVTVRSIDTCEEPSKPSMSIVMLLAY